MLHLKLRQEVEAELGYFMEFDPFVAATPHHQYFVRSLYFDDPARTAFYDKIDGLRTRSKFRIRTYCDVPDEPTVPQFLEEKGRHDNRVFKHRILIEGVRADGSHSTLDAVEALIKGDPGEDPVRERFRYGYWRKRIRPLALVDYLRRPYISRYDPEFRVTFDDRLRGTATAELFPKGAAHPKLLLPGYTIMEVKFGDHVPAWFHRIIQSYELRRVSISKIVRCMSELGLATDLL